jgi:thermitase
MNPNLIITAAGVVVALFIGGMQVWIASTQVELSRLQGELQSRQDRLQTVSSWLPFLISNEANVRLAAVHALARIEGDAVIPPLVTALADDNAAVRDRAGRALTDRVTDDNVDAVVGVVVSIFTNAPGKSDAALETLVKIGGRAIGPIQQALRNQDLPERSRRQAAEAIERILLNERVMRRIGVLESHEITLGRPEIVVALVGGGVDPSLPDVAEALIREVDHVGDASGPAPSTALAARLLVGHPGSEIVGVAPGVSLLSEKVLSSRGGGAVSDLVSGIDHATEAGADVMYLELGGVSRHPELERAIERAHARGALIVAAAGHTNTEHKQYPAAFDHVIAVAAVDDEDRKSDYSRYGDWIDIAAPGNPTSGQEDVAPRLALRGTSFSGSLVAGAAALVWSVQPEASAALIERTLLETAVDLDATNPELAGKLGRGRLDVLAAVKRLADSAAASE